MITFSGKNFASPSTITTASRDAAKTIFKSLSSCSLTVGFKTNSPLMRPSLAPAIGPSKGNDEIITAAEAPHIASKSASQDWSDEITVARS